MAKSKKACGKGPAKPVRRYAAGGGLDATGAWNASVGVPDPTLYRSEAHNQRNVAEFIREQGGGKAAQTLDRFLTTGDPEPQRPRQRSASEAPPDAPPAPELPIPGLQQVRPAPTAAPSPAAVLGLQGPAVNVLDMTPKYRHGGQVKDYGPGGKVPPGPPGRDTIPAKIKGGPPLQLDNGEYAVPDEATRMLGKRNLDATVLALTGKPPVGYEPGGRVALVPPGEYADGGRVSGWNVDRAAQIEAAVNGAAGGQPVPQAPQGASNTGTDVRLSADEQAWLDMQRAKEAETAQAQKPGWKRMLGFAKGGQVTYGDWQPLQGGLEDYVQRGRQRAVYGAAGADVPQVSDAEIAARPAPNTRALPGSAENPAPRAVPAPVAASAQAGLDPRVLSDTALPERGQVWTGPGPAPQGAQPAKIERRLGEILAGPGRPPESAAARSVLRVVEGGQGNGAVRMQDLADQNARPVPQATPATGGGWRLPEQMMPGFPTSIGGAIGQGVNDLERAAGAVGGAHQALVTGALDWLDAAKGGYRQARPAAAPTPPVAQAAPQGAPQAAAAPPAGAPPAPVPALSAAAPKAVPARVAQVRPASGAGFDAQTMSQTAQRVADRAASPAVAGPNDYITPMQGTAGGRPIYRNLVAPDGQAEYGGAIYSDSVPGATRAGLDQAIREHGTAQPVANPATLAATQQAQAGLDLAKKWYGMKPSERGVMPDKVADTLGVPRAPKPNKATIEERRLALDTAKAGADQYEHGAQRAHERGIKAMELEAGMSKEQRAAAAQWDDGLRSAITGLAKRDGDSMAIKGAGGGVSPSGEAWALRTGSMLRRTLPGLDVNAAAGHLYGAAAQILGPAEALAAVMKEKGLKEATPSAKALAEEMVKESEKAAQDQIVKAFFGG